MRGNLIACYVKLHIIVVSLLSHNLSTREQKHFIVKWSTLLSNCSINSASNIAIGNYRGYFSNTTRPQ